MSDTEQVKVKRFVLMGGPIFYASGGFKDYLGSFDTRQEADDVAKRWAESKGPHYWAHIVDLETSDMWSDGQAYDNLGLLR